MLKVLISGCNGHMGRVVAQICREAGDVKITAGFDLLGAENGDFPVLSSPAAFFGEADVLIDFSSPAALPALLEFGVRRRVPLVLATTGYSAEQAAAVESAAERVPIFRSGNMSLGINVLMALVTKAAAALEGFDVEIVERHHNRKLDAPSGTALMLAQAAAEGLPYVPDYVYERESVRKPRDKREIGISSIRGGNIVGDHEVLFAGRDEAIELRHSAMSREVFASGALRAARFLAAVPGPGLYSMKDLVGQII
ncbi:4-hydroxy-tetrahydrodipicolinate reductase [Candidatus Pseudoscillospira sp. SGI.172]|uniref:4-hydroxy-tetrahydrodipicolinate reductase n=1 Tax=Candidatus Pseudoscillospira sp. SGI.172 TaxID=3420582 RepID=UPI003D062C18